MDPFSLAMGGIGLVSGLINGAKQSDAVAAQQAETARLTKQNREDRLNATAEAQGNARATYASGLQQLDKLYGATNSVLATNISTARKQADLAAARSGLVGGSQAQNLLNPSITAATVQAHQMEQQATMQLNEQLGQNLQGISSANIGAAGNLEANAQAGVINAGTAYANPFASAAAGALAGLGSGMQMNYNYNKPNSGTVTPGGIGGSNAIDTQVAKQMPTPDWGQYGNGYYSGGM